MSLIECNELKTIHDNVLVCEMSFDEQITETGIIIGSDNGKSEGIKPRWAKVYAIGKDQTEIKPGDWILIEHGRWTRGIKIKDSSGQEYEVRRVETSAVMMISDHKPSDVYLGRSNKSTTQTFDFSQPMF